ncbi:protein FAM170A-like [Dipodomys spectabilis]|uniref:protein FAM170A-like n=1 Tax=Dipodomys spectabilis TaxID=105255 RepID=UPI001C536D4A|nr:protein FAM170A-like [Dipodomys spectabilis]
MKQKQKRKHLERTFCPEGAKKSRECRKLQKGVPQTRAAVQAWSPAPGDDFSTSEYFSCVSSPSKLALAHKEAILKFTAALIIPIHNPHSLTESLFHLPYANTNSRKLMNVEDLETCSPILRNDFPGDNRPSTSSALMRNERIMKVYYMHVQLKRGVAVLEDTKGGLEPPKKKMRIESIAFPEKIRAEVNHSDVLTHELLHDSEFNSDDEGQEKLGEAESLAQPATAEERSRARTPEWLVAMNSGYRCMACCRVFPSLAVLQEHVENGVNEGFSCHVFHQVFGWLKSKRKKGRDKMKKN